MPGLTHTILLRNLPIIEMAQTIGRVIRVHKDDRAAVAVGEIPAGAFHLYKKPEGIVTMPTGYKMGNAIATRLQSVVNQIFMEGRPSGVLLMLCYDMRVVKQAPCPAPLALLRCQRRSN